MQRPSYSRIYVAVVLVSMVLMLVLPPPSSSIFLLIVLIASAAVAVKERKTLLQSVHARLPRLPSVTIPARIATGIELALILLVLALATQGMQNWASDQRVSGNEFAYLINSGVIAAKVYHQTGAIPLWNPLIGPGEPLLENPFSFVLNPLMTLPIFWFGAIQGTKIAVLLHAVIMALGGWALAKVLGLKAPARMLLALLLGGSGSMVGAISMGFYQMSLSQTYVPWVYTGLLGVIYRKRVRTSVALLTVAGMLLIFAGTFWYVLPTAIGCALLVVFHAVRRVPERKRLTIDWRMLACVLLAGLLLIGLTAVRLLPQFVHYDYINHPLEYLNAGPYSLLDVLRTYITPYVAPPYTVPDMYLHFILPLSLMAFLVVGRGLLALLGLRVDSRWRIVLPALVLIVLFSLWGEDGAPFVRWLYQTFPLLREWRFVGRMLAAATPWIAVIAAIWLDDIVQLLARNARQPEVALLQRWRRSPRLLSGVCRIAVVLALILAASGALEVEGNWNTWGRTQISSYMETEPLTYLRRQRPGAFLSMLTDGFFDYLPFYDTSMRAAFGNPDYHPLPVTPTMGTTDEMSFPPEYGLGYSGAKFLAYLPEVGYQPMPIPTIPSLANVIWRNPLTPSYVFTVHERDLAGRQALLDSSVTQPVTYFQRIDVIDAVVGDHDAGTVLVAQETAYPGWQVSVDGQAAPIESVGGLIGVRLPDKAPGAPPTSVEFAYCPPWLYTGAAISLASMIVFVMYALRIDERVKRRRRFER